MFQPVVMERLKASRDAEFAVSPLVRLEALTKPKRDGDYALVGRYERHLSAHSQLSISDEIFDAALELRSRYLLKTPDALHLAIAQHHGCTRLWTNDERLASVPGGVAINVSRE